MGINDILTRERKKLLLIILGVLAVLWYLCLIIVPIFPNSACPVGLSGPGSIYGGSSGGSPGGGTCPACNCDRACPEGYLYDTGLGKCMPRPPPTYCATGVQCPIGKYDTGMDTCRCATGYTWDTNKDLCCPTNEYLSTYATPT